MSDPSSDTPPPPLAPAMSPAPRADGMNMIVKVLLSIAVIGGVVGFFRHSARNHTSEYKMVDEVAGAYGTWIGKPLRLHGFVEPGSIDEKVVDQEMVRTFVLEKNGKRMMVRNKGPKPDSFKDRSEVVAEGKLVEENGEPVLVAHNLMAKCPSKYEGAPKDKLFGDE